MRACAVPRAMLREHRGGARALSCRPRGNPFLRDAAPVDQASRPGIPVSPASPASPAKARHAGVLPKAPGAWNRRGPAVSSNGVLPQKTPVCNENGLPQQKSKQAVRQGEGRWTHSMGGERLDISEEMANPPPLRNLMTCWHYGGPERLVNRVLRLRYREVENRAKTVGFVIFRGMS